MSQLAFDLADDMCRYGTPKLGEPGRCHRRATHAACWAMDDGRTGRIECCRDHADYYASAWVPRYPGERTSAWIDILA